MKRDRLVQLVALFVAVAAACGAGVILPTIIDKAGQEYVVLVPIEDDSFDLVPGGEPVRIYTSEIQGMAELAETGDSESELLEIGYDAGTKTWEGHLDDALSVTWRDGTTKREMRGRLAGIDGHALRYTDVSVEGAPPVVALGTAIGALRGIIVDYLWIKVNMMKEKGQFYEVMSDADLITKLQPRFGEVWSFHGHNMAYNISVLTNTREERWDWVKQGIDLVRNSGLRYNPNDVILYKDLAFWFAHKLDGVADDAHLHYKRELAKEWHFLLGDVPYDQDVREDWIKGIADAPESIGEAEERAPGVQALVDEMEEEFAQFNTENQFKFDKAFLMNIGKWLSVKTSNYARILGLDRQFAQNDPIYAAFDRSLATRLTGEDQAERLAAITFLQMLRKKVLRESYNMDPEIMYEYTRDYGPLDWRHPQAHAFYWGRLGSERGAKRYEAREDLHKVLNNDRITIQAMQALARSGMMTVDPFSNSNPGRLNDPRWIRSIDQYFRKLYDKHFKGRGGGVDSFTNFHENFMKQAVRELWRAGEYEDAKEIYAYLNQLYGEGGLIPHSGYDPDTNPIEDFVRQVTEGEYEMQPEVARSDVYSALRRGFREGMLLNRPEILEQAVLFAAQLTEYFQKNEYNNFVNKFGEGRMSELIGDLRSSVKDIFRSVLLDQSMPLLDRIAIYNRTPAAQQVLVYDLVNEPLRAEFNASELASAGVGTFDDAVPEPPGMDEYRSKLAAEAAQKGAVDEREAGAERK
ncbi:MAG: hypothetical protein MK085_03010 [Phycisphaerales bacterium]|nr:hypothetical protein [Phycisphaerales bacterium]